MEGERDGRKINVMDAVKIKISIKKYEYPGFVGQDKMKRDDITTV